MRLELIRPDDLVNLEVETVNLHVKRASRKQPPKLVVQDAEQPSLLIVRFPSQTIAETAYFEWSDVKAEVDPPPRPDPDAGASSSEALDPPGVTGSRDATAAAAHASRLVFVLPNDAVIPLTIEGLLDWSSYALSVSAIAAIGPEPTPRQIASAPTIAAPADDETGLELPYRLIISPNTEAAWRHRLRSFTARGRTELWHSRLLRLDGEDAVELTHATPAPLRALWSPDYGPTPAAPPHPWLGRTAMDDDDRRQIVVLTSAFHGWESTGFLGVPVLVGGREVQLRLPFTRPYVPQPFEAELVMLSALGGWLRSRGNWSPPSRARQPRRENPDVRQVFAGPLRALDQPEGHAAEPQALVVDRQRAVEHRLPPGDGLPDDLELSEWVHVAAQGRDHYVRIVYDGVLRAFGHKASLVKVTERKFKDEANRVGAYLMQRMFIVPREHLKTYPRDDRGMPFKRVEITTRVTPDIAPPQIIGHRSFWVEVMAGGKPEPFQFHCIGTDVNGDSRDFTIPLMFVSRTDHSSDAVLQAYNDSSASGHPEWRDAALSGQEITFAEPKDNENTRLVTETLNFFVNPPDQAPKLLHADVRIPQVQQLAGSDEVTTIRLSPSFVASGFDAGAEVFAEVAKLAPSVDPNAAVVPETFPVKFQAQNAGGLATPNLAVSVLSRGQGPLAGTSTDAQAGTFDASSFFGSDFAHLFGTFDLGELIDGSSLRRTPRS